MERRAVVPARFRQHQEVANVVRRPVRFHLDLERSHSSLERDGAPELIKRRVDERLRLLLLNGDALDADRRIGETVRSGGRM